jgi:hypothetical protein
MQPFSLVKAFCALSMFAFVPLACGDDESNPKPSPSDGGESNAGGPNTGRGGEPASGGSGAMGGAPMLPPGISETPSTEQCAEESCESARVGALGTFYYIDPCCAGAEDACGLNTQFLELTGASFGDTCQPKNQPGELDGACPATEAGMIPVGDFSAPLNPFPGCCRPNGTCGVQVNEVVVMLGPQASPIGDLELGCVDAEPFFPGEDPVPCGDGAGGGGNAGAGGVPGDGAGGAGGAGGGAGGAGGGE